MKYYTVQRCIAAENCSVYCHSITQYYTVLQYYCAAPSKLPTGHCSTGVLSDKQSNALAVHKPNIYLASWGDEEEKWGKYTMR